MIKINKTNTIFGTNIHVAIESGTKDYSTWVKRVIEYANLKEGKDYISYKHKSNRGQLRREDKFNLDAAAKICAIHNTEKGNILYQYISNILGEKVCVEKKQRKELCFKEMLETIIPINWEYQRIIGNYRIDFVFGDLIIEYDELYHESENQQTKDNNRETEIKKLIKENRQFILPENEIYEGNITFIRVKQGKEYSGIKEIYEYLLKDGTIAEWYKEPNGVRYEKESFIHLHKQNFIEYLQGNNTNYLYYNMPYKELIDKVNNIF